MPETHDILARIKAGALGQKVELSKIGESLEAFFGADETLTRASLMNFAIYSESPESLLENHRLIRELTREHACRALLIVCAGETDGGKASSWVDAHCNVSPRGAKAICSEQITFLLEGKSSALVPSIVLSHLDSDLPLVLWWQGELSENFEAALYSRVDRLIVDGSEWQSPHAEYVKLTAALEAAEAARRPAFILHDLAWTRGHHHRLAVAACFDDPQAQEQLPAIDRIVISHTTEHRPVALFTAAWLANQIGAQFQNRNDGLQFQRPEDGAPLIVQLDENPATQPGEALQSVEIHSPSIRFHIRTAPDPHFLLIRTESGDTSHESLVPAPSLTKSRLVSDVLMRSGNNALLRKTLPPFLKLLETE